MNHTGKPNLILAAALGALLIGAPSLALARDGGSSGGGHGGPGPSASAGAGMAGSTATSTATSNRGRNPAAGHHDAVDVDGPNHEANDANEAAREAANEANEAAREAANEANEAHH